jgi:hypothetical protein
MGVEIYDEDWECLDCCNQWERNNDEFYGPHEPCPVCKSTRIATIGECEEAERINRREELRHDY